MSDQKPKQKMSDQKPKQKGTVALGPGLTVPLYVAAPGQSGNAAVAALGLRGLARREQGDVVAIVDCGDGYEIRCVAR